MIISIVKLILFSKLKKIYIHNKSIVTKKKKKKNPNISRLLKFKKIFN